MSRLRSALAAVTAALALTPPTPTPARRRFNLLGYGALGGAGGSNPFPAPRAYNAHGARHVPQSVEHDLEINRTPQPWQKRAAKQQVHATLHHLGWNERRRAREARNARAKLPELDQKAA